MSGPKDAGNAAMISALLPETHATSLYVCPLLKPEITSLKNAGVQSTWLVLSCVCVYSKESKKWFNVLFLVEALCSKRQR